VRAGRCSRSAHGGPAAARRVAARRIVSAVQVMAIRVANGVAAAVLAGSAAAAAAQSVAMSGRLGDKAVLVIDGAPRTLTTGATVQGVKLVRVSGDEAVVEVKGRRQTLLLGGAQVSIGAAPGGGNGSQIVLTAGSGGHFVTGGTINGRSVNFLVDTGATYVAIGATQAEQLGLDYKRGRRGVATTANGPVVSYRVVLDTLRVGDVLLYGVEAVVSEGSMPFVLLGNSFLTRFQMKRENEILTLSKRF
jgi:aspartyl protease family protein